MKKNQSLARLILLNLLCAGFLLSSCLFCGYSPRLIIHNKLHRLISQLEEYPLPANSRIVNLESSIQENTGNGDYCLYMVRQTIATFLSREEIESYYADAVIPGVNEGGLETIIVVAFSDKQSSNNETIYIIEAHDMTERYFDFGCK